jgi:hypothetical protein
MTNDEIDALAVALDKVLAPLDDMVPKLAQAVQDGVIPAHVASVALKKFRQGRLQLLSAADNQSLVQLDYALQELREERKK